MSVINTNITSMIGQQNLRESQNALQTSMERLSSGLRINSAKDDAAGQAIANRMSSQITGLAQSQRNANDGISVAQTAEGGLNQVNDNLQRIRELTVQSQNGTNSSDDLQSIQDEITQRLSEIDRISAETNFNGTAVLAADRGLDIQVGANDGETISVNLQEVTASALGLGSFDANNTFRTADLEATATDTLKASTLNPTELQFEDTNTGADTIEIYRADDGSGDVLVYNTATSEGFVASYNSESGELEYSSTGTADVTAGDTVTDDYTEASAGDNIVVGQDDDGNNIVVDAGNVETKDTSDPEPALYQNPVTDGVDEFFVEVGGAYYEATIDTDEASDTYGQVSYDSSTAVTDGDVTTGTLGDLSEVSSAFSIDPADAVEIDNDGLAAAESDKVGSNPQVFAFNSESNQEGYVVQGNVDGETVYYSAEIDQDTGSVTLGDRLTEDPLAQIDSALNTVDSFRSELGAVQNRFESAITNLSTNETNLSAARSRIEDADYAMEVADMTRSQILQQAGTSVLAQANQLPQNVLSLLG